MLSIRLSLKSNSERHIGAILSGYFCEKTRTKVASGSGLAYQKEISSRIKVAQIFSIFPLKLFKFYLVYYVKWKNEP